MSSHGKTRGKETKKQMTPPKLPMPSELDRPALLHLYEQLVLLRRFESITQIHNRKGEMPGFLHLYIGEEATAVGVMAHLRPTDWITSTHRGHGHALAKGVPAKAVMAELYGKATGCCQGRGGTMHLYDRAAGLFGTNGIVGAGIPQAVGAALSARVRGTDGVAVALFGDGAVNHGAFHEGLNFAGIQKAPVVFVCENNLYATATPLKNATLNTEVATKAAAYGIPGIAVDGNDVVAVWQVAKTAVERARRGEGPTLIESKTYRVVGHHEGDPVVGVYRTAEEVEVWKQRCPVARFRQRLLEEFKVATAAELDAIEARYDALIKEAVEFGRSSPEPEPATLHLHVFAEPLNPPIPAAPTTTETKGWLDAVRDGVAEEMRRDPHIIYLGEGIGERGGSFAHTKNLWQEFGGQRVIDTPICEMGFTGAAIGASATGCRAVADLMFADFLFETAGQVVVQAAKLRYMSNGQMHAPVVLRAPCGSIKSAGPHHSGMYHPVWAHVPGLIVVVPSNPADAKGLIKTALRAGDPVVFLEPKGLFATKGPVPVGEYLVPFGVANVVREGNHLTLVSCGQYVALCGQAAAALDKQGVTCDVIDLRSIVPLDVDTILTSLKKTGRLLVVDEGWAMCGIGAEIAAAVMEHGFDEIDAPIGRLHVEATSHPFSPKMEAAMLVNVDKIITAAQEIMAGRAPVQRRLTADVRLPAPPVRSAARSAARSAVIPERATPPPSQPTTNKGEPILMPHGDLTVTEATVVKWLKQLGDSVASGEAVVEVETEKAVTAIEAPAVGKLAEILAPAGTVVKLGQQLGTIQRKANP